MQPHPWRPDFVHPAGAASPVPTPTHTPRLRRIWPVILLPLLAGVLTWLTVAHWGLGLCDNGDGWRLMRRALITERPPAIQPLALTYQMAPLDWSGFLQSLPRSTSGLAFFLVAMGHQALGSLDFHLWEVTSLYHLIYLCGMALWAQANLPRGTRILATATWLLLLLTPYTLALFHSPLEEAGFVAILPAWSWSMHRSWRTRSGMGTTLALSLAATLAKPQTLLILPAVLWTLWRGPRWRATWQSLMLIVCVCLLSYRSQVQHAEYNAFNRLSTGVAYSLAHVSAWPQRHFEDRREVDVRMVRTSDAQRLGLQSGAMAAWGHGYWPYCQPNTQPACSAMATQGRLSPFIHMLLAHPEVVLSMAKESWQTAIRADYRLSYIFMEGWQLADAQHPRATPLSRAGLLWWLAIPLVLAAGWQRKGQALVLGLLLLTAPLLVTLADGYFEYERHLLPYMALIPVLGLLQLPSEHRRQTRTAQPSTTGNAWADPQQMEPPQRVA